MMRTVRLLELDAVPAVRSQSVYHAVAYAMTPETPDTIILVSPADPYVCVGYHQDVEKEVDLDFCRAHHLPVYRREVGGGAVYLDYGQIFSQWVFQPRNLPASVEDQYISYIKPLVATYQALGINAYHRPINDIHVDGRKIGGTGAAQIGQAEVLVGSLMLSFDKATMSHVLKVPSEKMRDKVYASLEQYMTTIDEQLKPVPSRQTIKENYIQQCAASLDAEITHGEWTSQEREALAEIDERLASGEWLYQKGSLRQSGVKIHQDVQVVEQAYKAPGGLIRVTARLRDGRIDDISISGDFTLLPSFAVATL